ALREHKRLTREELLEELNHGMFRFRTSSPLREIHAALLRHPHVKKTGHTYIWNAPPEKQIPMRLRVAKAESIPAKLTSKKEDSSAGSASDTEEKEENAKVM